MSEFATLYSLNIKEMKLICLFHNGKEAVIDFLAYLQSNETTPLNIKKQIQKLKVTTSSTCPRYFKTHPTEFERICKEFKSIKTSLSSNDDELFNSVEHILRLGNLVNEATEKKYANDYGEKTTWYICHESAWSDYWNDYTSHIVKILTYLNEKNYIDERKLYQKRIEVEIILYEEYLNGLYAKYLECLNHHYGSSEYHDIIKKYSSEYRCKFRFTVQFHLDVINAKSKDTNLYFLGSKKIAYGDIYLNSEMTEKIMFCGINVFTDKLGEFNRDRYLINLGRADWETIKISGRKEGRNSCYDCTVKSNHETIPFTFRDYKSEESLAYWKRFTDHVAKTVKEMMGVEVYAGISSWDDDESDGSYLKNVIYISKLSRYSYKMWSLDELYELEKVLSKVKEDINKTPEDIYIATIDPCYDVPTKNVYFVFHIYCKSPGLTNIIKELIPYVQETILNIEPY